MSEYISGRKGIYRKIGAMMRLNFPGVWAKMLSTSSTHTSARTTARKVFSSVEPVAERGLIGFFMEK